MSSIKKNRNNPEKSNNHRFICSIPMLDIEVEVDAKTKAEALELAREFIVHYFERLSTRGNTIPSSSLLKLLIDKEEIEKLIEVTFETVEEGGVYRSNLESRPN